MATCIAVFAHGGAPHLNPHLCRSVRRWRPTRPLATGGPAESSARCLAEGSY